MSGSTSKPISKSIFKSVHNPLKVPPALLGGSGGPAPNPLDSIADVRTWSAEDPTKITLSGADITAWNEKYLGSQNFSFATLRPTYAATGGPTDGPIVSKPVGRNLAFGSAPIVGSP